MPAPRANLWLDPIVAYAPGKSGNGEVANTIKLSSNENPLGPSPRAVAAMRDAIGQAHRYPDGSAVALRSAIAAHNDIEVERIVCGTGSDELLQLAALAYAAPGDEVLMMRNSFMVYPIAARRAGALPVEAPDRAYAADVDALLERVSGRTKLVYLANPNNPTGTVIPMAEVRRLHAGLPQSVLLVLDCAYIEYCPEADMAESLALARDASNVLHMRTFSKIHGLAAERIGWAYGAQPLIDTLHKIRGPFNVTSAGQAGAIAALEDRDWARAARAHNDEWRPWLEVALRRLGLEPIPSAANFLLVRVPASSGLDAASIVERLAREGVMVRYFPNGPLVDCFRVSVGLAQENERLVAVLTAMQAGRAA